MVILSSPPIHWESRFDLMGLSAAISQCEAPIRLLLQFAEYDSIGGLLGGTQRQRVVVDGHRFFACAFSIFRIAILT